MHVALDLVQKELTLFFVLKYQEGFRTIETAIISLDPNWWGVNLIVVDSINNGFKLTDKLLCLIEAVLFKRTTGQEIAL